MASRLGEIFVFGAGKVGRALAGAAGRAGLATTLRAARRGWPAAPLRADLVIIAVRDGDVARTAERLAEAAVVGRGRRVQAVVHCAGALGPETLQAVRGPQVAVGQMHPLLSFASPRRPPGLGGGLLLVRGEPRAVGRCRTLGRRLGMRAVQVEALDLALYHAAAVLVAGGSAALVAEGTALLERAGMPPRTAEWVLGPLLRSVAENVERLGLPAALTGPVRRGAPATVQAHLEALPADVGSSRALYLALARSQLAVATALGEAPPERLEQIRRALDRAARRRRKNAG